MVTQVYIKQIKIIKNKIIAVYSVLEHACNSFNFCMSLTVSESG